MREEGKVIYKIGEYTLNALENKIYVQGNEKEITRIMVKLLLFFLQHRGETLTVEQIERGVWKQQRGLQNVQKRISDLNRAIQNLGPDGAKPGEYIIVKVDDGYRLREDHITAIEISSPEFDAYNCYNEGRYYWERLTPEGFERAVELFQKAIIIKRDYALPYVGLADVSCLKVWFALSKPDEEWPKVETNAHKAMELKPYPGEAYTSYASYLDGYKHHTREAEINYQEALKLRPHYGIGNQFYANFLARHNRFSEARGYYEAARKIDPGLPFTLVMSGFAEVFGRGDLALAVKYGKQAIENDENFFLGYILIGRALAQQGKFAAAVKALRTGTEMTGGHPLPKSHLGITYALWGKRKEATRIIEELRNSEQQYVPPTFIAQVYAVLGDQTQALDWLKKAQEVRDVFLLYLKTELAFDGLRKNQVFQEVLRSLNFLSYPSPA